jgi:nucleotide-binding universal stress UspA family protein
MAPQARRSWHRARDCSIHLVNWKPPLLELSSSCRLEVGELARYSGNNGMKRILVPIDCSPATLHVLDLAKQVASVFHAEIHLVYVKEVAPAVPPSAFGYGVAGMPELMPMSGPTIPMVEPVPPSENESYRSKLADWQKELTQAGLKVTLHEPSGDIVEEILREADSSNADLIVMGRHGHGAMYNLLVGSVTEGVLKRSVRPVLLVPSSRP